jgi:hypothetical protein
MEMSSKFIAAIRHRNVWIRFGDTCVLVGPNTTWAHALASLGRSLDLREWRVDVVEGTRVVISKRASEVTEEDWDAWKRRFDQPAREGVGVVWIRQHASTDDVPSRGEIIHMDESDRMLYFKL